MKINYNKSDLITMGASEEEKTALARFFFAVILVISLLNILVSHCTSPNSRERGYSTDGGQNDEQNRRLERQIAF